MTDHPKPIARYATRELGVADYSIVDTETGIVFIVASRIHAERITDLLNGQDARIAELERELHWHKNHSCSVCLGEPLPSGRPCVCKGVGTASGEAQGFREEMYALHTAIEALAREWRQHLKECCGDLETCDVCYTINGCASELLALLEKKP